MCVLASAAGGGLGLQLVQIAGAVCVLAAFAGAQAGWLNTRSLLYLQLNLAGSTVLAVLAVLDSQFGFLLLEGVWAIVSAWSLVARFRDRKR